MKNQRVLKMTRQATAFLLSFMLTIGALLPTPGIVVGAVGTEVTVTTLAMLRTELESSAEKTIIVGSNISINSGYMIEIPSGANITLRAKDSGAYTLTASTSSFAYGAIQVKKERS